MERLREHQQGELDRLTKCFEVEAENAELRRALEMISNLASYNTLGDLITYKDKVRAYARAALEGD